MVRERPPLLWLCTAVVAVYAYAYPTKAEHDTAPLTLLGSIVIQILCRELPRRNATLTRPCLSASLWAT